MADLADIATATTAGYKEVVLDRGSGANPATRYEVVLLSVCVQSPLGPLRAWMEPFMEISRRERRLEA